MQNTSTQRPDYASIIPGNDTRPVQEQARVLLASVRIAIKHERVQIGEFNRGYFDEKLSKVFNRNAAVSTLRASRPKLLPEARKTFYDFKIAIEELETSVAPEVENAVLTLIANEAIKKPADSPAPQLQPVKAPVKEKSAQSTGTRTVRPRKKSQPEDMPLMLDEQSLIYQRAEKILSSALEPIQQKRVQALGKTPEGFEERFSKIVDSDPSIASMRAKTPEVIPEILKQFRDFQMAVEVLNYQHISEEIQHAALSIIINRLIEKPRKQTPIQKGAHEPVKPAIILTQEQRDALKAEHKIKKAQEREGLNLLRRMLEDIGRQIRQESRAAVTKNELQKAQQQAKIILLSVRQALREKQVNVMGGQKHLAATMREALNRHNNLTALREKNPSFVIRVEEKFRRVVVAGRRLGFTIDENTKAALIDAVIKQLKEEDAGKREKIRQTAIKNGQTKNSREAACKTMTALRNDPVKAKEHNESSRRRIKELYEDPADKSKFRSNRELSFSQQQRDVIGRFIKTENEAVKISETLIEFALIPE
ncbi:MAG: hypothetical protein KA155_05105 [Alphaproteobacteria bacterium]|jgi:hypothetical protein|nr:hypothetical protein [Alphaproteobacteria bacterium]